MQHPETSHSPTCASVHQAVYIGTGQGRWCFEAWKVPTGLAVSNGSLLLGLWLMLPRKPEILLSPTMLRSMGVLWYRHALHTLLSGHFPGEPGSAGCPLDFFWSIEAGFYRLSALLVVQPELSGLWRELQWTRYQKNTTSSILKRLFSGELGQSAPHRALLLCLLRKREPLGSSTVGLF